MAVPLVWIDATPREFPAAQEEEIVIRAIPSWKDDRGRDDPVGRGAGAIVPQNPQAGSYRNVHRRFLVRRSASCDRS